MELIELRKKDETEWNDYISKSQTSTFYHQIGWKNVIERTYGHQSHYLMIKEGDRIIGVLPLFLMKSMFFGKKMVSVPFGPYGGVCADNNLIENELINEAIKLTQSYGAKYLELRNYPVKETTNSIEKPKQVTSILYIDNNTDRIWDKMKRDKKRGIKKALEADVKIDWNKKGINEFFNLYSETMHSLGAPSHSITFFKNILLEFPDETDIVFAKYKNEIINCIFLLYFKDTIISGWSASDRSYSKFYPNELSYWEVIKKSIEKGYKNLDFGRSMLDSGVHEFKSSFGAETLYFDYNYYLNKTKNNPDNTTSNKTRQKFAQFWRQIPRTFTNALGPKLRSNFP